MKKTILVIDDDKKLNQLLKDFLGDFGFHTMTATRPAEGLKKLRQNSPALVILDVMLPEMNGFEVCKRIRQTHSVPVIMLTARGEPMDKIVGLEIGADDYMSKPFEPRELVARIQAVLRRFQKNNKTQPLKLGRLEIDFPRRIVLLDGNALSLTTNEFTTLALLAGDPGKVFDRDQILQELRGIDSEAFNRTVDITISRLRQKLNDDPQKPAFIKTVWGAGYVFIGKE
jgi:DNA-binding response OmpR family regulator